jgi:hypothetical protein
LSAEGSRAGNYGINARQDTAAAETCRIIFKIKRWFGLEGRDEQKKIRKTIREDKA